MSRTSSGLNAPGKTRRLRLAALAYGLALLVWLGVEDNAVWPVTAFGFGLACLLAGFWLARHPALGRLPLAAGPLLGAAVGVGTALATTGLMLLKTGLHSHLFPDYPPAQMLAVLERAPAWALAGGLAGLGVALAWLALRR